MAILSKLFFWKSNKYMTIIFVRIFKWRTIMRHVSVSVSNLKNVGEYNSWNIRTKMKSWIKQGIRQTRNKMKSWVNQCIRQTLSIKKKVIYLSLHKQFKTNIFIFFIFWLIHFFSFLSRNEDTSKKKLFLEVQTPNVCYSLKTEYGGKKTMWQNLFDRQKWKTDLCVESVRILRKQ